MARATDKPTQRVLALLEILRKRIEEYPGVDEFFFDFEELRELNPILSTVNLVENIASDLSNRTNDAVIYKKLKTGKTVDELPHGVISGNKATFSFIINNPEKLTIPEEQKKPDKDNKIYKMEILEDIDDDKLTVFINEDYFRDNIRPKKGKDIWTVLLEIARDGRAHASNPVYIADYVNKNKNFIIYTKTGCSLTNIVKINNDLLTPNVEITTITKKALAQRRNEKTT